MEKMGIKRGSGRCAEKGIVWELECSDPGGSKKRGGDKERKERMVMVCPPSGWWKWKEKDR